MNEIFLSEDAKKTVSITEAVEMTLHTVHEFGLVLINETRVLKDIDQAAIDDLQPAKIKWAEEYRQWILTLNERKEEVRTVSAELKQKLSDAYNHFAKVTDENARTLLYKKQSAERILKVFINAAKRSVPDAPNYSSDGFYGLKKDIPIAFKVNQTT